MFSSSFVVLLLAVVLLLIFKDDKGNCTNPTLSGNAELSRLLNDSKPAASERKESADMVATPYVEFTGKFELYSSENFDEFLTEIGVGYFTRLAATRASSEYVITKDGDSYTLRTISTFGESSVTFKSDIPFTENRIDGATVETVIEIRGNKWVQKQKGEKEVTIVREFNSEGVIVTSVVNNVACVRKYRRL